MSAPQLFCQHNLSVGSLYHALHLGGLACPSLAITRSDIPYTKYGEITLVAHPSLCSPKRANVYDADQYVARHPECRYDIDKQGHKAALKRLERELEELGMEHHDFTKPLKRGGLIELTREIRKEPAVLLAFARSLGRSPRIQTSKKLGLQCGLSEDKRFQSYLAKLPSDFFHDPAWHKEIAKKAKAAIKRLSGGDPEVESVLLETYLDGDQLTGNQLYVLSVDRRRILNPPIDTPKLVEQLEPLVNKHAKKYAQWMRSVFGDALKNPHFLGETRGGNPKKIPYNLENITRYLRHQGRGSEDFNYGTGSMRAMAAQRLNSWAEIQAEAHRIVSEEDLEKHLSNNSINRLLEDLAPHYGGSMEGMKYFDYVRHVTDWLHFFPRKGKACLENVFDEVTDVMVARVQRYFDEITAEPTMYFEATVNRAVTLDEFHAVVAPDNLPRKLRAKLKEAGIENLVTYEARNPAARLEALNTLEGVSVPLEGVVKSKLYPQLARNMAM